MIGPIGSNVEQVGKTNNSNNTIVSAHLRDISLLSLGTSTWTTIKDAFKSEFDEVYTSYIYARGSVYVFGGGKGTQTKYSRYSLAERQCYEGEIVGIVGGSFISTCYDGDKSIYLVGGELDGKILKRVGCFNIDTQQFSKFNLHTKVTATVSYYAIPNELYSACFDNSDNIYILSLNTFSMFSLATMQTTKLKCPDLVNFIQLRFVPTYGVVSLCGAGKNYLYSVRDNKWIHLKDNDPVVNRSAHGSCIISN
ncbi:hypothetical protein SAMD00019534_049590 [Acytostelium subglobosum LB1]|uniref:hypothetical protein n=1 Tax=Acytostelium subglobosum LB1 TaxID=1410327 RepID=UPI000644C70B|nr:hypothetical protein SAMD00019534_049590 [Acytostelium subglobosum LB1]GAM21784.1 hypothetical protein SAMD00019534_049590 [Acytostelium subglobosum LB1]|eukprot:XP_012754884.1 hypothetical protein SAMD00019534_049590 [Acytostelium subglobosum LB1]